MISLTRENVAIHRLASKEVNKSGRTYVLPSAAIEVSTKQTVATNGHYLVAVEMPDQDDGFEPFNLAIDSAKNAERLTTKKQTGLTASKDLDRIRSLKGETMLQKVDGKFPKWTAVMPKASDAGFSISLDPANLREVADMLQRVADPKLRVRMTFASAEGAERAVRFDTLTTDGRKVTALLMPCRDSGLELNTWDA